MSIDTDDIPGNGRSGHVPWLRSWASIRLHGFTTLAHVAPPGSFGRAFVESRRSRSRRFFPFALSCEAGELDLGYLSVAKSPNHEQGTLYSDVREGPFLLDFVDRLDRQTGSGSGELEWERRLRLVIRLTSDRTTMQGVYIS